jgi:NAD(P)-dependent dehydrogenase (short-subunit alcohol dehydrogenase family)
MSYEVAGGPPRQTGEEWRKGARVKVEGSAMVTGASRGIGRAVAVELARRGFFVLATMRDPSDGADLSAEVRSEGGQLRVAALDLTKPGDLAVPDDLRVLVNNAGTRGRNLAVENTPMEEWREIFETNVFGTIDVTRQSIPALRQGGGVICNITSSSILAPLPFFGAYRAGKAAISALSETLRVELAPFGIRVVEILPGPIDTHMHATSVMYRVPEAVEHEPYREVAERCFPGTKFVSDELLTAPASAAVAIVDAIFDDDGPMRYGCDPMSTGSLAAWRSAGDEEAMTAAVAYFAKDHEDEAG